MLRTTLPNGLKVLVQENHASAVVAVQVWVQVGSADEAPHEAGLAHVHEHMLFKGTARRPVGAIAADIEAAGGDINAWTSFDQTVYHVTIASRELDVALDILSDAVQHSAFDADELQRELEVVLEEVRRGRDQPSRVASEMLLGTAFQKHPYARPVIGYEQTIRAFDRPKIIDFYRRWYQPRNMCLVVVGDVQADDVVQKAGALFEADLNRGAPPVRERSVEPPQDNIRGRFDSQDIQETHLALAWPATRLSDDDTPVLDVLTVILGTGESSRLFRRVKWTEQLVNDCYAVSYTPQDPGVLIVAGQVHGDGVVDALRALLSETLRLRYEDVDARELAKAKTIIQSDTVYQQETVQGVARKLGYFELVAGEAEFEAKYLDRIRSVTAADVRAVAKRYLRPDAFSVSALTPQGQAGVLDLQRVRAETAAVVETLETNYRNSSSVVQPPPDDAGSAHPGEAGKARAAQTASGRREVTRVTLDNGAKLLVLPDDTVPLVSVRAAAVGGLLAEQPTNNGVTHLMGSLLVRGTERYPYAQIMEEVDSMAGGLYGVPGRNSIGLRGDFLAESWSRGFELFASCLMESSFPEDELDKERQTQLEDIAARQDSPSAVAMDRLLETLYAVHPYRMPSIGTESSVGTLTRSDVVQQYRDQLRPDGLTLCVVGDVDLEQTVDMIQSRIGQAKAHADARSVQRPRRPLPLDAPRSTFAERDKEQAHLVLGFRGYALDDNRHYALDLLSSVLGGQSGRLFIELRDRQSLAYSVGAYGLEGLDAGYFAVYIGTAPEKVDIAEEGIRVELDRVLQTPVTAEELSRAQRYLVGAHEISMQRASARCGTMTLNEAYGLGYDAHLKYAERIMAVTRDDLLDVARDVIRFEQCARSVVGPGSLRSAFESA